MKKYALIIMMELFALCAFAQGTAVLTMQDFEQKCKILNDRIGNLKDKLPEIKEAEQKYILRQGTENETVSQDQLAFTDSLLAKAGMIVFYAQKTSKGDSVSIGMQNALLVVSNALKAFVSVNFSDEKAQTIQVRDDFQNVSLQQLEELTKVLETFNYVENDSIAEGTDDSDNSNNVVAEDESLSKTEIVGIICLMILICMIAISFLNLKSNCSKLQKDLLELGRKHEKVSNYIKEESSNNRQKNNATALHPSQSLPGLTEVEIRRIVQEELNAYFSKKENIQPSLPQKQHTIQKINVNSKSPAAVGVCLYGQLQNDSSFKVSSEDKSAAYFVINLKNSNSLQGEFSLKKMDVETLKAVIEQRQMLLAPACDILVTASNASKIVVEASGVVAKQGNRWIIQSKAQIKLES